MLVPVAEYFTRRSWYLSGNSVLGSKGLPASAWRERLYRKPSHIRSGDRGPKDLAVGVRQAPSGSGELSGAICRLKATKHTITQPHSRAKMDRPAISTGRSNFTAS